MAEVDQVDYDPAVDPVYEEALPVGGAAASHEGQASSHEGAPSLPRGVIPHVLFVSRFSPNTTPEEVKALMETYGPVRGMVHKTTVAFIEFENPEHAFAAKHDLHRTPALGSESLVVDFKKNNTGVKNFDSEEQFMDNSHDERGRRDRGRDRDRGDRDRDRGDRDRRGRPDDRRREERPDRARGGEFHRGEYRDDRRERGDSRDYRDSRDPRDYRDPRDVRDPRDRMGAPLVDDRYRGPMRADHPPMGYPPHGYRPDDRRMPYGAEPPMYRSGSPPRGPPHQGGPPPRSRSPPRSPPRDDYEDRRPPAPYDDRRGPKRSFDGPAGPDYRFSGPPPRSGPIGGPPIDARSGALDERGPPVDSRSLPPHIDSRGHPGDYYPPRGPPPPVRYDIPPQGKYSESRRPVEPSAYAAGANRPRDFERAPPSMAESNGRYPTPEGPPMSGHPMSSRPMRDGPLRGDAYPPSRRDGPPPEYMQPHGRPYSESRADFRGPGDDYSQGPKRPRY